MTAMAHGNLWDGHLLARGGTKRPITHDKSSLHPVADAHNHAPLHHLGDPNIHARVDPAPDAEPFFVDLSECRQHACRCTMEVVEGDPRPTPSEFRCKEIWELVNALGVWGEGEE
ncbi:hypothetical protein K525DRAFT_194891 [Schizophyllum commune Loenen D]|nr:hypothetical protein K525DRAFT_194891 [Schizophyllum commune Loenen D]